MKLVDANVLLYAVNRSDAKHESSKAWLDGALSGRETVGFSWLVLLAFLRLSTRVGLYPNPLTIDQAFARVRSWLLVPTAVVVEPTPMHLDVLSGLLRLVGSGGNLVSDANLAALALEHDATIVSYDNDFDRFEGVSWERPQA